MNSNQNEGHASKRAPGFKGVKTSRPKPSPVIVVTPHPDAWKMALELAGGNPRLLIPQQDGSVIAYNNEAQASRFRSEKA